MKKLLSAWLLISLILPVFSEENDKAQARQNITRAMALIDAALSNHFTDAGMARFYNPYTNKISGEKASVWMYTSAIEAVNATIHALNSLKEHGDPEFHLQYFNQYVNLLDELVQNLEFYAGTFTLTSYAQTKTWTVYGVDRGKSKGNARVEGIYNVYDDQQWLVRELLESYNLTGNKKYLTKAEYLTEYILDGWDCTLNEQGKEHGGITWGPGYTTKHACSNGPMVSPLVWLSNIYNGKNDEITYSYIDADQNRKTATSKKNEYYLAFAKKIYAWQKDNLLREDGVFHDMLGGCDPNCAVAYETTGDLTYRKHTPLREAAGKPYSYNSGTMISGAADLYSATRNAGYLEDAKKMALASFAYFAKLGATIPKHYTYPTEGFSNWFNGVLMRSYVDIYPSFPEIDGSINSFQKNLDYAYGKFRYKDVLPSDLLSGWNAEEDANKTEGMFSFTFAAEYAVLARHQLEK